MEKLNCIFMGTPDFSVPTLRTLSNLNTISISKIITMPDRPSGRGKKLHSPPVAQFAKEHKLPLLQTENINHEFEFLEYFGHPDNKVDIIVVIAFAQFLNSKILNLPKIGCFNIHTSILPKYRGAAPIQYALLNGDSSTGVSIQKMVKKMDAGEIGHFKECPISNNETAASLFDKLKLLAAEEIKAFLDRLISDEITWRGQDENQVSYAPSFKKTDGLVNINTENAIQIERKVRAFNPWPGTYCYLNNLRIKIISASLSTLNLKKGEVNTSQNTLVIGTKEGSVRFNSIQLPGKKVCSDTQFINNFIKNSDSKELIYSTEENK